MLFIILMPVLGIAVAVFRRSPGTVLSPEDAPLQLLRWTTGLLSESRGDWGQAMLGELDHIEDRRRRWRFTIGCAGAAFLLPWGRAAAGVLTMIAVAIGSFGLYADVIIRHRLGIADWIGAAITLTFLASLIAAASVLLRRPGLTVPGILGGLFVAVAWLAMSGFTFYGFIAPMATQRLPLLLIVVPAVVGVAGHAVGR